MTEHVGLLFWKGHVAIAGGATLVSGAIGGAVAKAFAKQQPATMTVTRRIHGSPGERGQRDRQGSANV